MNSASDNLAIQLEHIRKNAVANYVGCPGTPIQSSAHELQARALKSLCAKITCADLTSRCPLSEILNPIETTTTTPILDGLRKLIRCSCGSGWAL
jgi:hypothetical protein